MPMKKILLGLTGMFLMMQTLFGQSQGRLTLEDIWKKRLPYTYFYGVEMLDGHRAVKGEFRHGRYEINIYDVPKWEKTQSLFSSADMPEVRYVYDYVVSPDRNRILLSTEQNPVYRHSTLDKYILYDIQAKKSLPFTPDYIQIPSFDPSGKHIVYVKDNNLYLYDTRTGQTRAVTSDGEHNRIINGKSDWLYEEEFSLVKAYTFDRSGRYLAYLKFDESRVPEFTMTEYGDYLYPKAVTFKYPKAGQPNSLVSLHIYDLQTGQTRAVDLGGYEYLPRLMAGHGDGQFLVMRMNRLQNELTLLRADAATGQAKPLIHRRTNTYFELERIDKLILLPDGKMLWPDEKSGRNHLYLYDRNGKELRQVTRGNWDITAFYGYDPKRREIFFQANIPGSIHRAVYRQKISGFHRHPVRLTPAKGTAEAMFTKDFRYFIRTYSTAHHPEAYDVADARKGEIIHSIAYNGAMRRWLEEHGMVYPKFMQVPSAEPGLKLNAWVMYPPDFDEHRKYPVLIYQYNGPGSQTVLDKWGYYNELYHAMLAQQGFIVMSVDTRGTGGRGANFIRKTYKQLGRLETEDLHAVGKYLQTLPYVDGDKIGIWGWSYGGFMASNAILRAGDVFAVAIAVAPVTDWRFYDTAYTERYMQTPDLNPEGYDDGPLAYARHLKGRFLIIHGTADDNVHVQNTYRLAKRLQEEGKDFDMMIYPDRNHGIYGGLVRYQLYNKMYQYLLNNLKN